MHIGTEIRRKLEERHHTVVWLAEKLSYTRANIYKIFDKGSIDTELLLRISEVLDFDFFALYSEAIHGRNGEITPPENKKHTDGKETVGTHLAPATA